MTLTEYLKKEGVVLEVDASTLPEGMNINQFVEVMTAFNVIEQDLPPVVIRDTPESREAFKKTV